MKDWIDNADSYICPRCDFECDNPLRYSNVARCPKCSFIPDKYKSSADVVSKELYEQIRFERDLNQRLYEALLKDVNDYQGIICNYCLKDQTDKCISPDEAPMGCGKFEWRGFNHDNTRKKREKYGEIKVDETNGD